jgi:DNA-binding transcriptional ArsR family regulator
MVKHSEERLDAIFHALSDGTRRAMLSRLAKGEISVTELAAPFDMSLAAVSKHLKVLESARFVEKTKDGRNFRCRANLSPFNDVTRLLEELGEYWRKQLDALDDFLKTEKTKRGDNDGNKSKKY